MSPVPVYGAKRDTSEPEVIAAFKAGGATVQQLSGKDIPDLLVGHLGVTHTVEVKTNRAKLKPGQARWAETWKGEPPSIARNAPQARKLLRCWEIAAAHAKRPTVKLDGQVNESQSQGGGVWAAAEEALDPPRPETAGKDPEVPA